MPLRTNARPLSPRSSFYSWTREHNLLADMVTGSSSIRTCPLVYAGRCRPCRPRDFRRLLSSDMCKHGTLQIHRHRSWRLDHTQSKQPNRLHRGHKKNTPRQLPSSYAMALSFAHRLPIPCSRACVTNAADSLYEDGSSTAYLGRLPFISQLNAPSLSQQIPSILLPRRRSSVNPPMFWPPIIVGSISKLRPPTPDSSVRFLISAIETQTFTDKGTTTTTTTTITSLHCLQNRNLLTPICFPAPRTE